MRHTLKRQKNHFERGDKQILFTATELYSYKTILGQIVSGDIEGAQTGIRRMKEKLRRQAYDDKKI